MTLTHGLKLFCHKIQNNTVIKMRMTQQEYDNFMSRKAAFQAPKNKKINTCEVQKVPLEDQEQAALVVWLNMNNIKHFATPNGGYRAMTTAKKMKTQGVVAGVPDITIIPPITSGLPMLWIELKRVKGGVVSPEQQGWISYLKSLKGHDAAVCKGCNEAINFIKSWGDYATTEAKGMETK